MTDKQVHVVLYRLAYRLQSALSANPAVQTDRDALAMTFTGVEARELADALAIAVTAPWMLVSHDDREASEKGGTAG